MPENDDFEYDLAAVAEHGHRTARLASAAEIRARADRRRRRRYAGVSVLGAATAVAMGTGIALARPDGGTTPALPPSTATAAVTTSPAPQPAPSAASSAPSPASSSAPASARPSTTTTRTRKAEDNAGPLSGERQLFIFTLFKGEEVPDSVVAVTKDQDVEITLDYGERALFVPVRTAPEGDRYVMKTGKIRSGGEAFCWVVQDDGKVVVDGCDFGDSRQIITIEEAGEDVQERMTYTLRQGDRYLTYDPQGEGGFAARDPGSGKPDSTYVFIDRGASTVPTPG